MVCVREHARPCGRHLGNGNKLESGVRKLLLIQASLVVIGVAVAYYYKGQIGIMPALFGGAIAIANTLLLSRRIDNAGKTAEESPEATVLNLYLGVIQRFVFVMVMFGVGMGAMKLDPIPLLGTFAVAQLAYMIFGTRQIKQG